MKILYFASLREAVGCPDEDLELPAGVTTAGALRRFLAERGGNWQTALDEGRNVRIAVNQQMARPDTPLTGNEEVAFFPPVTGG